MKSLRKKSIEKNRRGLALNPQTLQYLEIGQKGLRETREATEKVGKSGLSLKMRMELFHEVGNIQLLPKD